MNARIPSKNKLNLNKIREHLEFFSARLENSNNIKIIEVDIANLIHYQIEAPNFPITFSKEEKEEMFRTAVLYYLMAWMENSESNKQSIYYFVLYKYLLKSEEIKSEENDYHTDGFEKTLDSDQRKKYHKMLRAIKFLKDNIALQNKQAKSEGSKYKRMSYATQGKALYNFNELFFFDNYSSKLLKLYHWLYYCDMKRDISLVKRDLIEAYKYFNILLESLNKMHSEREVVITYLSLYKFEKEHRFIFAYKLGKYMNDNQIPITKELPPYILKYICRDKYTFFEKEKISRSFFIFNYEDLIKKSYENPTCPIFLQKLKLKQDIIAKTIALYNGIYPHKIKTAWSEEDFTAICDFIYESDKILDCFEPLNLYHHSEKEENTSTIENSKINLEEIINNKNQYDYIINLYNNSDFMDQELLSETRRKLQEKRYFRNKKRNNNSINGD